MTHIVEYEKLETVYRLKAVLEIEAKGYGILYQECATYKDPDSHAKALGFKDLLEIQSYYGVKTCMLKRLEIDIKTLETEILKPETPNPFGQ